MQKAYKTEMHMQGELKILYWVKLNKMHNI